MKVICFWHLSAILFVKTLPKSIAKSIDAIFQYTLFDTVKLCNGFEVQQSLI